MISLFTHLLILLLDRTHLSQVFAKFRKVLKLDFLETRIQRLRIIQIPLSPQCWSDLIFNLILFYKKSILYFFLNVALMLLCSQWPLFLCSLSCSVRRISFFLSSFVLLNTASLSAHCSLHVSTQQLLSHMTAVQQNQAGQSRRRRSKVYMHRHLTFDDFCVSCIWILLRYGFFFMCLAHVRGRLG